MIQIDRHTLFWGVLRYILGIGQMTLATASVVLLLTIGLQPKTYFYVGATTTLTIISRVLYRGKRYPRLKTD